MMDIRQCLDEKIESSSSGTSFIVSRTSTILFGTRSNIFYIKRDLNRQCNAASD